jgi:hypothetical protein
MAEMHGLNRMFEKLKDKKDFEFISFTYEPESVIKEIILKYNIKYKVIHIDKTECYRLNFNNGYPTSLILDKDCRIKFIKVGGAINEDGDDIAGAQVMEILLPKILDQL